MSQRSVPERAAAQGLSPGAVVRHLLREDNRMARSRSGAAPPRARPPEEQQVGLHCDAQGTPETLPPPTSRQNLLCLPAVNANMRPSPAQGTRRNVRWRPCHPPGRPGSCLPASSRDSPLSRSPHAVVQATSNEDGVAAVHGHGLRRVEARSTTLTVFKAFSCPSSPAARHRVEKFRRRHLADAAVAAVSDD